MDGQLTETRSPKGSTTTPWQSVVDVRDSQVVDRTVDSVAQRFGKIDVAVINAGLVGGEAVRSGRRLAQRIREAARGKFETSMEQPFVSPDALCSKRT
jgi:NAD(P)-dependent dehydrogenase (short-subunit alcohol dehydrogenase family)